MRILRVAQTLYPDVTGGGPYHVHAMSRDQAAMGHDVTVLTVRTDPSLPHHEERAGYTVLRYDSVLSPLGNDISPGLATQLATAADFDVVHAHSHLYFSTNLAALRRALDSLPLVSPFEARPLAITNHGLYSQTAPEWLFDAYLRTAGRWTFDRADVVFCYTDADRARLREVGVESPIAVVPNGIDTERFSRKGPADERVAAGDPSLLFVGRLVEGKRPGVAIAAAKRLRETYPDCRLAVCGDGPLRETLAATAGPETVFLGEVDYDDMPAVYRGADAFVLPSRAEGTPRTVLEALSVGLPVACSDLPHLRDAFGDGVRYFEGGDVDSLVRTLEDTLDGDQARAVDQGGPDATPPVPDWSETVRLTTDRLEALVAGE